MTEQWIQGRTLQRIMFRDGLVLNLDEYNELVISAPLELTLPDIAGAPSGASEVVTIDPTAVRNEQKPLFDFAGTTCTHADWDEDGSLHLQFSGGQHIDVPSDDAHTSWELYGKLHGYAACLPHGRVRVVRHDLPD
ncbi:DUF6188 family protein [Mycolicibacterium frederiksbergense]|jgi:hypothetical protein|uniref:DUF6188 family protein n=1 Tax=Mycolicibacterium frederiksbergense TaxID=117567 RepID=UPI00399AB523